MVYAVATLSARVKIIKKGSGRRLKLHAPR